MKPSVAQHGVQASTRGLGPAQLAWLAAAVFVVSAGYGALMPLLPGWLAPLLHDSDPGALSRHVGYLSGAYTAGVLVGAPLWGLWTDRFGRTSLLLGGLVGYVASLVPLLRPEWLGVTGIYLLRGANGFFVAAVIPVVPALVAEHTPRALRARRYAWLGASSLLGFFLGPGLSAAADPIARFAGIASGAAWSPTNLVIALSTALGALTMLGLAASLPAGPAAEEVECVEDDASTRRRTLALWLLNGVVMAVLAGFELGIVLQGQQHPEVSSREVALMFAECSLVMLAVNALLFFTGLLDRTDARKVLGAGLALAIAGLGLLSRYGPPAWLYVGVSLTAAGTGLVLPTISYMAAGSTRRRLGAAMGGLAAAASFGQTLGSAVAGWLFGVVAQAGFVWLAVPLVALLGLVAWWPADRSVRAVAR